MKKIALVTLAAAIALAGCDSTPNDGTSAADDVTATTAGANTTVVTPGPTATETTVVTTPGATTTATGDTVSVGPNGVSANVGDSDTRVKVDTNGDAVTVQKK